MLTTIIIFIIRAFIALWPFSLGFCLFFQGIGCAGYFSYEILKEWHEKSKIVLIIQTIIIDIVCALIAYAGFVLMAIAIEYFLE